MFSRCPLKRNHGPAIEIWSVVHFPLVFISKGIFSKFDRLSGAKGDSFCNRLEFGSMIISKEDRPLSGAM